MWKYCDPENHDLKAALAAHLGIPQANVVVGEGIDGLLGLIVRMYLNPGDAVVTSLGAYPTFNFHVAGFGGRLVTVPYAGDREDLDALARGGAPRERSAGLLVQSRQSDGHLVGGRRSHALHRGNAQIRQCWCWTKPMAKPGQRSAIPPLDLDRPNIIRTRTFSKAYGLAGLRCGYAIGETETIGAFDKVRNHFGVNKMAQVAAQAALADQAYLALGGASGSPPARERIADDRPRQRT